MSPNTTPSAAMVRITGGRDRVLLTVRFLPRRRPDSPRSPGGGPAARSDRDGDAELDAALGLDAQIVGERTSVALQRREELAPPIGHPARDKRLDLRIGVEERRIVAIEVEPER